MTVIFVDHINDPVSIKVCKGSVSNSFRKFLETSPWHCAWEVCGHGAEKQTHVGWCTDLWSGVSHLMIIELVWKWADTQILHPTYILIVDTPLISPSYIISGLIQ